MNGGNNHGERTKKEKRSFHTRPYWHKSIYQIRPFGRQIRAPDIIITCTDSAEQFDDNKNYMTERLSKERNSKVQKVIKKDIEFLDNIQMEMATARQFLFTACIKGNKDKRTFDTANRIEKTISEQGFEVHRLAKEEIKRFLALYFDASMSGELMPDIDGSQFFAENDETEN